MTTPTVRPAGPADIDELVRLILAFRDHLGAKAPDAASAAASIREVQAKGVGEFALASLPSFPAPVGYLQMLILPSVWTAGREAYLEDVFVERAAWRQGVGTALLRYALERARRAGATVMALTTNEQNEQARAFYSAHGFREAGEARYPGGREVRLVRGVGGA